MDQFRQYIKDKIDHIDSDVNFIKTQVTATNGRVKKLELWRSFISGGLAIFALMMAPVIIKIMTTIFTHGLNLGG